MTPISDPASVSARAKYVDEIRLGPLVIPYRAVGAPQLLVGLHADRGLTTSSAHLDVHGALPRPGIVELVDALDSAGLIGRGGAAYPVADKVRALRPGPTPAIVVNGAEGEPTSSKDHLLLAATPHLVLDGADVLAHALGASRIVVAVCNPHLARILTAASAERPGPTRFQIRQVKPRYLAGESHALLSTLNGGNGLPPGRPTHATDSGLGGAPTLLFNAETYAQIAVLTRARRQPTPARSFLVTVTGAATSKGVYELPTGTLLGQLMDAAGVHNAQFVMIGGYHGVWRRPDPRLVLTPATAGTGAIAFLGADTCPLGELAAVAHWLADQSALQCRPCYLGLPTLADNPTALQTSDSPPMSVAAITELALLITRRGACAHPDGAVRFIANALEMLTDEIDTHLTRRGCGRASQGHLALTRAGAMAATRGPATPPVVDHFAVLGVDPTRCAGHRVCAAQLPTAISVPEGDLPQIDQRQLAAESPHMIRRVVATCPTLALYRARPGP